MRMRVNDSRLSTFGLGYLLFLLAVLASVFFLSDYAANNASAQTPDSSDFTLNAATETLQEGETAQFTIALASTATRAVNGTWMVECAASEGQPGITAADLQAGACDATNTFVIPIDESLVTISVMTIPDNLAEFTMDGELLTFVATTEMGAMNSVSIRIMDDDALEVGFSSDSYTVSEGSALEETLMITTAGSHAEPFSISVSISDCETDGARITGADFSPSGCPNEQELTFMPLETSKNFRWELEDDDLAEGAEVFTASISTSISAINFSLSQATITVTDELDSTVSILSTIDSGVAEGDTTASSAEFSVELPTGIRTDEPLSVRWEVDCAGAVDADDFRGTCPEGIALIGTNATATSISLRVEPDTIPEGDEIFTIRLLSDGLPKGFSIANNANTATTAILGDDIPDIGVMTNGAEAGSEGGTAQFSVFLPEGSIDTMLTIGWEVMNCGNGPGITGITAADFIGFTGNCPTGTVTIPASSESTGFDVGISDENLVEEDEQFTVRVSLTGIDGLDESNFNRNDTALYTIENNDNTVISVLEHGEEISAREENENIPITILSTAPIDRPIRLVWMLDCISVSSSDLNIASTPTSLSDGTLQQDCDNPPDTETARTVQIPAGTVTVSMDTFMPFRDDLLEPNEEAAVRLLPLANGNDYDGRVSLHNVQTSASMIVRDAGTSSVGFRNRMANMDNNRNIIFSLGTISSAFSGENIQNTGTAQPSERAVLAGMPIELRYRIVDCADPTVTSTGRTSSADFEDGGCIGTVQIPQGANTVSIPIRTQRDFLLEDTEMFVLSTAISFMGDISPIRVNNILVAEDSSETFDEGAGQEYISSSFQLPDSDRAEIIIQGFDARGDTPNAMMTFGISLRGTAIRADRDLAVNWEVICDGENSVSDEDFFLVGDETFCGSQRTVTIGEGISLFRIIIPPLPDSVFEPDEHLSILISAPEGGYGSYSITIAADMRRATASILNDDPLSLTQESAETMEGILLPRVEVTTPPPSAGRTPQGTEQFRLYISPPREDQVVPIPPSRFLLVNSSIVNIDIRVNSADDAANINELEEGPFKAGVISFFENSRVCIGVDSDARRVVGNRFNRLKLYHEGNGENNGVWEELENVQYDDESDSICGDTDGFSLFALGYPEPVERSILRLLPPTGGVTLYWQHLLSAAVIGMILLGAGSILTIIKIKEYLPSADPLVVHNLPAPVRKFARPRGEARTKSSAVKADGIPDSVSSSDDVEV